MKIPIYQVDAFTSVLFSGNPAAVCPLESWMNDRRLQAIAAENNLSETAFFVPRGSEYELRWFTPTVEVDLCGHATLASAHIIFKNIKPSLSEVRFHTQSGLLTVERERGLLSMILPSRPGRDCTVPEGLTAGLGCEPAEVLLARDYLVVLDSEDRVRSLKPDLTRWMDLDCLGVIVTAPGRSVDFVSRFFAPKAGVDEDPVTGSAHCTLIPYWSNRLSKQSLHALQVSKRGGELFCEDLEKRVKISGHAVIYLEGFINT